MNQALNETETIESNTPHVNNTTAHTSRKVAVAGATGLVGRALVAALCEVSDIKQVHTFTRSTLNFSHSKLIQHPVDFNALPTFPTLDELYLAIGTTIKSAGSQAAFYQVDYSTNLQVAQAAVAAGVKRIGLVSAIGAHANSRVFYNRTKGELEQSLQTLPLEALVIARPSLLKGDRKTLGQKPRIAESFGLKLDALLRPIIPQRWRAITATQVAAALIAHVPIAEGVTILSSDSMQQS